MDTLLELLAKIPFRPLGAVIHVGAGGTDPTAYAALQARRLVLVDGRADAVDELRTLVPSALTRLEVVQATVSAVAGPVAWRRYNLPWLDGPADAAHLSAVYPRLTCTGEETRQAMAFAPLLAGLLAENGENAMADANVLLLDLPGQEAALLDALDAPALTAFGWIAIRAGDGIAALAPLLIERFFDSVPGAASAGDLWPVALFRRASRRSEQTLRERAEALARQADTLSAQARAAGERCEHALRQAEARDAELMALRDNHEQIERSLSETLTERDAARQDANAVRATLAERDAELQALRDDRGQLERSFAATLAERDTELQALRDDRGQLERSLAATLAERDAARQDAVAVRASLADRDVRQRLLDAEILRAQAQLELVKDVLLREKNF